jgi:hypothetical protein
LDLPKGETLFVLLRSKSMAHWAKKAMVPVWPSIDKTGDEEKDIANLLREAEAMGRVRLPRRWQLTGPDDTMDHTPYFVRLKDMADPQSVVEVDPENLAKAFGPGVKLKDIFIEITNEPVTIGLEKRLPWLVKLRGKTLDGKRVNDGSGLANELGAGSFQVVGDK